MIRVKTDVANTANVATYRIELEQKIVNISKS